MNPTDTAVFAPPTLPQKVDQRQRKQYLLEWAVQTAVKSFMHRHFACTDTEDRAVADAIDPLAKQIRREVFKVLRKHRRKAAA